MQKLAAKSACKLIKINILWILFFLNVKVSNIYSVI